MKEKLKALEKQLGASYKIKDQLGRAGARSLVYLVVDNDNKKYALKLANNDQNKYWLSNQLKTLQTRDKLLKNYNGNLNFPKTIKYGEDFILEEYAGVDFDEEFYNELNDDKKEEIAFLLADFLNYIHQLEPSLEEEKTRKRSVISYFDMIDYIKDIVDTKEVKEIYQKYEKFKKEKTFLGFSHRDIRGQNILFDESTQKYSLIDFELLTKADIYRDFVPGAPASVDLPFELIFRIIDIYNSLEKNVPIKISKEKVFVEYYLGIINEYVRCSILRKETKKKLKTTLEKYCFPKLEELKKEFQI